MPDANPVGAGIEAVLGLGQTITNLINQGKTKREAEELARSRPQYKIDPSYAQSNSLAESELSSGGLSSKAEAAYDTLNNQQFGASLGAILHAGGSVNNVADLYGNNESGRTRLALLNDQMRVGQIDRLIKTRQELSEQGDKAWQINTFAPYMDKVVANGIARQKADQGLWQGLSTIGAAGINYSAQQNSANNYNDYFNPSGGRSSAPQSSGTSPVMVGAEYDMNNGNQLTYNTPTFNPSNNNNNYNWYNP